MLGASEEAANIAKASGTPNKEKVGKITKEQAMSIVKDKMQDLNTADMDQALKIIEGTARSMGIEIEK